MKVVIQLLFANIQVVFEKLEQDHLHFVEIPHLAEKAAHTIDQVLQQVEVMKFKMGHEVHESGIALNIGTQVACRLKVQNLIEIFYALSWIARS